MVAVSRPQLFSSFSCKVIDQVCHIFRVHQNYAFLSSSGMTPSNSLLVIWPNDHIKLALVFYDYFLTFPDEVALIWPGNLTFTKTLFYLSRYPFIFFHVFNLLRSFWYSSDLVSIKAILVDFSDNKIMHRRSWYLLKILSLIIQRWIDAAPWRVWQTLLSYCSQSQYLVRDLYFWAWYTSLLTQKGIFTLRTFAIYQKNGTVLTVLGSLGLGVIATYLVRLKYG